MDAERLDAYLAECRGLALSEIHDMIPGGGHCGSALYDLMLEYPLRAAKALRPALCVATCRALGGRLESVARSAAVLELYHNAFLIHDDVEDGSEQRRGRPTLHQAHGLPIAVNVGDAMLALTLPPLLDNMRLLGMGKALRILQVIARMARESAEGQAIELEWIRRRCWRLADSDYVRMVYKKTSWYSFVAPVVVGAVVAGAETRTQVLLRKFAALLGIAFQIQDDALNLTGEGDAYGKEIAGDLWEGKHTLIIMHMMRTAAPRDRERAQTILLKPRPTQTDRAAASPALRETVARLAAAGALPPHAHAELLRAMGAADGGGAAKTAADVDLLRRLIDHTESIEYARRVAQRFARKAERLLQSIPIPPSVHRDVLHELIGFVITRDR
jgi:geranylgeranyl diphosphate synthase type II